MEYCGLDLGRKSSRYCVVDDHKDIVRQGNVRQTQDHLRSVFSSGSPMRVIVEATTQAFWTADLLRELGHDVRVVDPNRTKAIGAALIKHDKLDARILALLGCADLLAEVCVPTRQARIERVPTVSRDAIVRSRTRLVNALRGTFASEGIILPTASPVRLVALFEQASTELPEDLCEATAPLWQSLAALNVCLHTSDRVVQDKAKRDPLLRKLQTVPGVGPITVTIFAATIIDPHRFASGRAVGAYLGLVPRLYQSGSTRRRGGITKHGNRQARWALTMAASALLNSKGDSALQQWARQLAVRIGRKKACCAIARRLAALLWAMWKNETEFDPRLPA